LRQPQAHFRRGEPLFALLNCVSPNQIKSRSERASVAAPLSTVELLFGSLLILQLSYYCNSALTRLVASTTTRILSLASSTVRVFRPQSGST
jgi:hypothetical protein